MNGHYPQSQRKAEAQLEQLARVLRKITFRPQYQIDSGLGMAYTVWFVILAYRPDSATGEMAWGSGGRRTLPTDATDSDIVRHIFRAFLAYEEHEARESFRYAGAQVFSPHQDLDLVAETMK